MVKENKEGRGLSRKEGRWDWKLTDRNNDESLVRIFVPL